MPKTPGTLQDLIDSQSDLVEHFYNYTRPVHMRVGHSRKGPAVPAEFTNWRDEQRAWRQAAVLFDQSHHMPELFLTGPDAMAVLKRVVVNSLENFTLDRAKQLVGCAPDGHVIGDCVAYRLAEESFELISGMTLLNWVEFQAVRSEADVLITRDHPTAINPSGRRVRYRFEIEGPNAGALLDTVVTGGIPELGFLRTAEVEIAGAPRPRAAPQHGRASGRRALRSI